MSDPLTLPNAVPSAHCDNCGRPSAGTMCEPCLRTVWTLTADGVEAAS